MRLKIVITSFVASLPVTRAYTATSRWAQAVAIASAGDALFLYGGKTDVYNQYSYTSAPWTNDFLYLPLSEAWATSSPPWSVLGGSSNTSSAAQGPTLAWHSISTYAPGEMLIFGGSTGPLSPVVSLTQNDSALLVDAFNRLAPTLTSEPTSWAGEPERRMRHASATSNGKVYIVGGESAEGSGNVFADHYVFDPSGPSFSLLSPANAPPALWGHVVITLSDGTLLVFGGSSQTALIPLSQLWLYNPSTNTWSTSSTASSTSMPSGRVAFCASLLSDGRVLMQGGADATLENTFGDGWILDTTQSPMVWVSVPALTQVGARKDHFCAAVGGQVLFGFGYGSNGPSNSDLLIYDVSSGAFVSSLTPASAPSHTTVPPPTSTGSKPGPSGSNTSSLHPSGTTTVSAGPSGSPGSSPSGTSDPGAKSSVSVSAVTIGIVFGVLALIASICAIAYCTRRRSSARLFSPLNGDDETPTSAHPIPVLQDPTSINEKGSRLFGLGAAAGLFGFGRAQRVNRGARRDMLADEDRSFDFESGRWSAGRWTPTSRRTGSGHSRGASAWSASAGSVTSVVSGAIRALSGRRREPSTPDWEKYGYSNDPFTDEAALMAEERSGSASGAYHDPFADLDPDAEVLHDVGSDDGSVDSHGVRLVPPHPAIRTALPPTADFVPMSPLIEQASRGSLASSLPSNNSYPSSGSHPSSNTHQSLGAASSSGGQDSSTSHSRSARPSSILDALPSGQTAFVRRSNSWWTRFMETPLLRRSSDASRFVDNFRDPNPKPERLHPIEESAQSQAPTHNHSASSSRSPSDPLKRTASARGKGLGRGAHAKSASSLQTANSEALEKMGSMAVVQREGTSDSTGSRMTGGYGAHAHNEFGANEDHEDSIFDDKFARDSVHSASTDDLLADAPRTLSPPPLSPKSPGNVAERVKSYERRLSIDSDGASPHRKSVRYGLAPRASLFVANPDAP